MSEHFSRCELCGCREKKLEKHHLVPKLKCKKLSSSFRDSEENVLHICQTCHRTIHAYYPNNSELRDRLDTKEKLMADERFKKYLEWKIKHPNYTSNSTKRTKH